MLEQPALIPAVRDRSNKAVATLFEERFGRQLVDSETTKPQFGQIIRAPLTDRDIVHPHPGKCVMRPRRPQLDRRHSRSHNRILNRLASQPRGRMSLIEEQCGTLSSRFSFNRVASIELSGFKGC